jgi:hypothetical protein
VNQHEFVREFGLDREARYDAEQLFARRRVRRQLLGVGAVLLAKAYFTWLAYYVFGWWGVAALAASVLVVLFIRGARGFSE